MIEEEQRKMQESILSLLHRKERERKEKMCDSVPEKSQLEKDIEKISIDKEVEKKVREDLGQNEHEKKRIQVPICNYGPSCKCNPVLPDDIFDQLEAGKEPGAKESGTKESGAKEDSNSSPDLKGETNLKTNLKVELKENEQPKRRKKRRNLRTAFEYNLKVDFHDANSNFYQLLSSEDEDDERVTEDEMESSDDSYIEMEATLEEPDVKQNENDNSEEESENSFISDNDNDTVNGNDDKRFCSNESLDEKGQGPSELNKKEVSIKDESVQETTQICDNEDVIIVEDIVDFASDKIDTKIKDSVEKEDETRVTPNETFGEKKDFIKHEVANNEESKQRQAQSRRLSLQENEDIKTKDQSQELLEIYLKSMADDTDKEAKENTEQSLSIPLSTDEDQIVLPDEESTFQISKIRNIATTENTEQEEETVKSCLLKEKIPKNLREYQEAPTDREEPDIGREVQCFEKGGSVKKKDHVVLMGKKVCRSKRRKERVHSANLKLSSKKINCDKDRSEDKLEMIERSMVKPFQDFAEKGISGLLFPRSNCRDIMGLLQQENTEDLNLFPDRRRRDREDFPTSSSKDHVSPQPLPPISHAMGNRESVTENVIMAPNWTRVTVADIILR